MTNGIAAAKAAGLNCVVILNDSNNENESVDAAAVIKSYSEIQFL